MIRVIRNKVLLHDAMQSIGYFAFVSSLFSIALPLINHHKIEAWPFVLIFLTVMAISYIFTLVYVIRPTIQEFYPAFGLKGIDDNHLPLFHFSNIAFCILAILFAGAGWYVVSMGLAASSLNN